MMTENTDKPWDAVWFNACVATMVDGEQPYGLLDRAAIGVRNGRIEWIGDTDQLPRAVLNNCPQQVDCKGSLVTPGLIDCHTHLIYGGNRTNEFEQRLNGVSYEQISRAGGGIAATVAATRAASATMLLEAACGRLEGLLAEGLTTLEIKSGYGLNLPDELKILRVARQLGEKFPLDVVTTFLGAHATPPEYENREEDYIDLVCDQVLPAVADENLADAVDAFCENIAFTPQQVSRVFDAAGYHKLPVKLHAEQLSDSKGAVLASSYGALSVDHLEHLAEQDVAKLAASNTVAVLLPGAFYFLSETKLPPVDALREHNVAIAIASDSNPGSSPVGSLLLMLNMACTLFKLTPEEALAGVTRNAARALGRGDRIGTLEVGKQADMVLWRISDPAELSYRIGGNPCNQVMYRGKPR